MAALAGRSQKVALWIIAIAALTWFLERTSSVLIPFVFSVFLYYIVYPAVLYIDRRTKIGHVPSVLAVTLVIAVLWTGTGLLVGSSIKKVLRSADLYRERLAEFHQTAVLKIQDFGFEVDAETLNQSITKAPILTWVGDLSGNILTILGYSGLVVIFLMFMLASRAPTRHEILGEIQKKITLYSIVKTFTAILIGVSVTIILVALDVEMAPLFGLLAYLLSFIPNVGALIATLLPVPIVVLQHGFGLRLLLVITLPTLVQLAVNIIETKMMGKTFDLHPVVVMLALVFWGLVWGIMGMLLAVPITAVLKVVFERFSSTRFISGLLSGRF